MFGLWIWTYSSSRPDLGSAVLSSVLKHIHRIQEHLMTLIRGRCMFRPLRSAHPLSEWNSEEENSPANSNGPKYQHVPSKFKPHHNPH